MLLTLLVLAIWSGLVTAGILAGAFTGGAQEPTAITQGRLGY
jgi:hypothetical protein